MPDTPTLRQISRAELLAAFKSDKLARLIEDLIYAISTTLPADSEGVQANLDAHIADTDDAHQASAIGFTPGGGMVSNTVQAGLLELQAGKQPLHALLTALAAVATTPDALIYLTGVNAFAVTGFSAYGRNLVDDPDAAAARTTLGLGTAATAALDTDGTLAANSDTRVPSQKAIKTYADQLLAAQDAMVFKGTVDCSTNPNYPAADRGHTYRVSVAGKIGGAAGVNVEAGDILLCLTDGTAAGNQAAVGAQWTIAQANIDGAVIGPASAVDGHVVLFDGVTGRLVKSAGAAFTPAGIGLGDVTNDAQTKAVVVPNTAPSAGQVLVGNAGGTAYAPVSLSGDASVTSTGAVIVSKINGTTPAAAAVAFLGAPTSANLAAAVTDEEGTGTLVFSQAPDLTDTKLLGMTYREQGAPTTKAAAATLTIGELLTGIIEYTGAAAALTLPTGANIEAGVLAGLAADRAFDFAVVNTGSGIATVTTAAGLTLVGAMAVAAGASARFRVRKTAANTFTVYRIA